MESSLIINTTSQDGKKLQKTITNLNPNATNAKLGEFAQRLTALTTNTYDKAVRINKIDVTEDDAGGGLTPVTVPATFQGKQIAVLAARNAVCLNDPFATAHYTTTTSPVEIYYNGDATQLNLININGNSNDPELLTEYDGRSGWFVSGGELLEVLAYTEETDNYTGAAIRLYFSD